jgi:hypothetical protein
MLDYRPQKDLALQNYLPLGSFSATIRQKGESTMGDFRLGSVPPSNPYGDRHPYDAAARKPHKHHDEHGQQQDDDTTDTFEASSDEQHSAGTGGEQIEDYYRPSEPRDDE